MRAIPRTVLAAAASLGLIALSGCATTTGASADRAQPEAQTAAAIGAGVGAVALGLLQGLFEIAGALGGH